MGKHKPIQVTRKTREPVKHTFTDDEVVVFAKELSQKTRRLGELQSELKKVQSSFKAKITEEESGIMVLSNQINDGWEMRTMDCIVTMNMPTRGRKLVTRADNGDYVREAAMDADDLQMKLDDAPMLPEVGSEDADGENKHIPDNE